MKILTMNMMGFIQIGGFQLMKMNNLYELRILEIDEIVLSPSQTTER
ncbi:hypothetical protein BTH160X_50221 [Brochothrix thermosphacta]|nr:hypothetical protein BTH160X_50221 [Brochothrix thermosphacta]